MKPDNKYYLGCGARRSRLPGWPVRPLKGHGFITDGQPMSAGVPDWKNAGGSSRGLSQILPKRRTASAVALWTSTGFDAGASRGRANRQL